LNYFFLGIKSLERSLKVFEQYNRWFFVIPDILAVLGILYMEKGEIERALEYLNRGLTLVKGDRGKYKSAEFIPVFKG